MSILFNTIGLIGVGILISAFFLLQNGRIKSDDMAYPVLNLIGAILHMLSLIVAWNIATLVIEIFWSGISIYGIYKVLEKKKQNTVNT